MESGYDTYVLADGVTSIHPAEVPIALERMRQGGVKVTTSESFLFSCMGELTMSPFSRSISSLVLRFPRFAFSLPVEASFLWGRLPDLQ